MSSRQGFGLQDYKAPLSQYWNVQSSDGNHKEASYYVNQLISSLEGKEVIPSGSNTRKMLNQVYSSNEEGIQRYVKQFSLDKYSMETLKFTSKNLYKVLTNEGIKISPPSKEEKRNKKYLLYWFYKNQNELIDWIKIMKVVPIYSHPNPAPPKIQQLKPDSNPSSQTTPLENVTFDSYSPSPTTPLGDVALGSYSPSPTTPLGDVAFDSNPYFPTTLLKDDEIDSESDQIDPDDFFDFSFNDNFPGQ